MEEYTTRRAFLVCLLFAVLFLLGFEALRALPIDVNIKFVIYLVALPLGLAGAAKLAVPTRKKP